MKTYTDAELKDILEKHAHWLNEDVEGWEDMRADLHGADLSRADLSGAILSRADLSGADLSGAILHGANLYRADLSGAILSRADLSGANLFRADLYRADLSGAILSRADLSRADLSRADLSGAILSRADLSGANLYRADLSGADLSRADLFGADLSRADLSGANLSRADLSGANLSGANNIPLIPYACPDFGMFIGWKKAWGPNNRPCIVQLEIPEDAKRLSAAGRKCRCDKAKVLSIKDICTEQEYETAYSDYDKDFIYTVGTTAGVTNFDENRWNECSTGIHFFINRQEAVEYNR